jgi:DNA-binding response OmpR family regulator
MLQDRYNIRTFTQGQDALDYIAENNVDLALLDYDMPTMTGYELLMTIRGNDKRQIANMPVIFITAVTSEHMSKAMLKRGATDYIHKPIDFRLLRQCIDKHLGIR